MKAKLHISRRNFILAGLAAAPMLQSERQSEQCVITEDNILGPFYRLGSPWRTTLFDTAPVSERLIVTGTVVDIRHCRPLIGAVLDVWQADKGGGYSEPPDHNLRGKIRTDSKGNFRFLTIVPGNYYDKTSSVEKPWKRAKHIHFIVKHPGYHSLTTQCYIQGDENLASDRYVKRSQIINLTKVNSGIARLHANFNIALEKIDGAPDLYP